MHDQQEPLAAVSEIHSNQAQKRSGQRQTSLGRRSDGGDFGSIANPASTPKQFRGRQVWRRKSARQTPSISSKRRRKAVVMRDDRRLP